MVFRNIQASRCVCIKIICCFQLKTRQLQHPNIGRFSATYQPRFQHRHTNIARHNRVQTTLFTQIAHQTGGSGFAIAARDGDDFIRLIFQ